MKQIKLNSGVFLLVEVPTDAKDFEVSYEYRPFCVWLHMTGITFPMPIGNAIYPANKVEIIGKGNEITEEVWKNIVEDSLTHAKVWKDYTKEEIFKWTAKSSGHSWIKSHGMKPETTLILKLK